MIAGLRPITRLEIGVRYKDYPKGGTIAYLMKNGERVGDNSGWDAWFLAKKLFGTVEVDVYVSAELNNYVLKTSLADANWGTDKQTGGNIDNDGFSNQEDDDVDGDGLKNGPDGPDTDNDGDGTLNADENMTQVNGVPLVGNLSSEAEVFDIPGLDLFEDDGNYWFGADTLPGGHTVSKNALCVGAIAGTTAPATYSSFGPTDDGRLKPDIVAQGGDTGLPRPLNPDGSGTGNYEPPLQVLSSTATFSPAYGSGFGTSIAAPVVAGAVTLLSELQENMRGIVDPFRSSTFKAPTVWWVASGFP